MNMNRNFAQNQQRDNVIYQPVSENRYDTRGERIFVEERSRPTCFCCCFPFFLPIPMSDCGLCAPTCCTPADCGLCCL